MKGGIRPTREVELQGVDIPEMGVLAYPELLRLEPARRDARPRRAHRAARTGSGRSGNLTLTKRLEGKSCGDAHGRCAGFGHRTTTVVVVRWPEQRADAERLARLDRPHLLLVEPGVAPPDARRAASPTGSGSRPTTPTCAPGSAALAARASHHPRDADARRLRRALVPRASACSSRRSTSGSRRCSSRRSTAAFPTQELFERIWDGEGEPSKVRVHVSRLRKRIRAARPRDHLDPRLRLPAARRARTRARAPARRRVAPWTSTGSCSTSSSCCSRRRSRPSSPTACNVPAVVGEIVAGVIVGPSVLGWVHSSEALQTLAQLGVILLLLEVGLEMDLAELGERRSGRDARRVRRASSCRWSPAPERGSRSACRARRRCSSAPRSPRRASASRRASSATSARWRPSRPRPCSAPPSPTTSSASSSSPSSRASSPQGSVSMLGIAWVVVRRGRVRRARRRSIGVRIVPQVFAFVRRYSRSPGTLVAIALAFTLGVSELAHAAQLAPIVGAFVAGIALARSPAAGQRPVASSRPVAHLLVPVFFLQIGIDADVGQFARPAVFGMAAVLLVDRRARQARARSSGSIGSPGDRLLVGIGMIPRGEVGLIFATLGLNQHVFGQDVYAALLLVVLVTTVGTPPALRWRLLAHARSDAASTPAAPSSGGVDARTRRRRRARRPRRRTAAERLRSSSRCAPRACAPSTPASPALLEWLEAFPPGPAPLGRRVARPSSSRCSRDAEPRSWRMLTASGVLQRCLPELDDALARPARRRVRPRPAGRASPRTGSRGCTSCSPTRTSRRTRRAVLLAALALDACDDDVGRAVGRSRGGRCSGSISAHASSSRLPRSSTTSSCSAAAARRSDALAEESVLQIAVHLDSVEQADALLPALARGRRLRPRRRPSSCESLHELVRAALAAPGARRARGRKRGRSPAGRGNPLRDRLDGERAHPHGPARVRARADARRPGSSGRAVRTAARPPRGPRRGRARRCASCGSRSLRAIASACSPARRVALFEHGCSIEQASADDVGRRVGARVVPGRRDRARSERARAARPPGRDAPGAARDRRRCPTSTSPSTTRARRGTPAARRPARTGPVCSTR